MTKEFILDMLHVLAKHRYIPNHVIRNFEIRHDYDALRAQGTKSQEAQEILSEKYYTSIKNISKILYQPNKNGNN